MPDILIRDVPDEVVSLIEQRARQLGLSRADDWQAFAARPADLDDPEVMTDAWA